jgi:hypothetical protein
MELLPVPLRGLLRPAAVLLAAAGAAALVFLGPSAAAPPGEEGKKAEEAPAAPGGTPALNALERKFAETMTNVVLAGRWRLVKDGKLGDEAEDRYTVRSATKVGTDQWLIAARIQYGGKDVTIPVPVNVFWAGDTPVISISNAAIPGLGVYTARVLIHDRYYTGTWSGPGHAGFLTGVIERAPPEGGEGAKDKKETKQ